MSSPLNVIVPAVGSIRRMIVRPRVDLPQPDSPTRPSVSPALISRSTPSTAWTWAIVRCITPDATGNHTLRSETVTSGSLAVHARVSRLALAASTTLQLRARLRHPARSLLRVADAQEGRHVTRALLDSKRAPRVESAAAGQVDEVGRQAFDGLERFASLRVEARDRPKQRPRVGM